MVAPMGAGCLPSKQAFDPGSVARWMAEFRVGFALENPFVDPV
jgi:hypothetical protein